MAQVAHQPRVTMRGSPCVGGVKGAGGSGLCLRASSLCAALPPLPPQDLAPRPALPPPPFPTSARGAAARVRWGGFGRGRGRGGRGRGGTGAANRTPKKRGGACRAPPRSQQPARIHALIPRPGWRPASRRQRPARWRRRRPRRRRRGRPAKREGKRVRVARKGVRGVASPGDLGPMRAATGFCGLRASLAWGRRPGDRAKKREPSRAARPICRLAVFLPPFSHLGRGGLGRDRAAAGGGAAHGREAGGGDDGAHG